MKHNLMKAAQTGLMAFLRGEEGVKFVHHYILLSLCSEPRGLYSLCKGYKVPSPFKSGIAG